MIMDRRTNESKIMTSNINFVNNHFWNCYEDSEQQVVVDTVTASSGYLDAYFSYKLRDTPEWKKMFELPA